MSTSTQGHNQASKWSIAKAEGGSGAYILEEIARQVLELQDLGRPVTVRWIPAHVEIREPQTRLPRKPPDGERTAADAHQQTHLQAAPAEVDPQTMVQNTNGESMDGQMERGDERPGNT
ncbi:hypothetical protein IQ07DRAFT_606438 [Pyrenochaeta sp. DS3sAY3a]|nr:hypothetical protein IQ07DRAFT_606438 [Pyrenochaeta sp. DS3sAY3a]